jgi:hypothetical protein
MNVFKDDSVLLFLFNTSSSSINNTNLTNHNNSNSDSNNNNINNSNVSIATTRNGSLRINTRLLRQQLLNNSSRKYDMNLSSSSTIKKKV